MAFKWVAWISTILLIALSLVAAAPGSTYKFSFLFLGACLWLLYRVRNRLHLHPFHFALFAGALLLHDLGTFGFYRKRFFNLQFDVYVHCYFGLVGGLIFRRGLSHGYHLQGWRLWMAVVLFTLGFGAIHELVEWASTLMLGPVRGMLKLDPNDPYDTQEDLFNNLLGSVIALTLSALFQKRAITSRSSNCSGRIKWLSKR
jgi:uncharacterized membrane protein YjdF